MTGSTRRWRRLAVFVALSAAMLGCEKKDKEDEDHGPEESAIEVGCAHFGHGLMEDRELSYDDPETSMPIVKPHTRYELELEMGTDAFGGSIWYTPEVAGQYLFMFAKSADLTVSDGDSALSPRSVSQTPDDCDAAQVVYEYTLDAQSYRLEIAGSAAEHLTMVIHLPPKTSDHDHSDHEH